MAHKLLLPNKCKLIGWFILIPAFVMGICITTTDIKPSWLNAKVFSVFSDQPFGNKGSFGFVEANLTNTIVGVLFIVGALLVGFSKEKNEDEFISNLRLSSLLWAVLLNYSLLLLAFLFVYDTAFLTVMMYDMFTVLIIFIIRFNYILYKTSKSVIDEK